MMRTITLLLAAAGALAAPPGHPSSSGEVWIQPSIMDSARDAVNVSNIPASAHNGAWVDANTGGVNNNPPSLPGNTTFLVAKPGQAGSLVPSGGAVAQSDALQAVAVPLGAGAGVFSNNSVSGDHVDRSEDSASNATVEHHDAASSATVEHHFAASNDTELSTVVSVQPGDAAVLVSATAVNATLQGDDAFAHHSDASVVAHQNLDASSVHSADASATVVAAPAVVIVPGGSVVSSHVSDSSNVRVARDADSTALVSSKVGSVESNQTIAVPNDQPIVAVLPPGTNLSATWDAQKGGPAPAVVLGSDFAAAAASVSVSNDTAAIADVTSSSNNTSIAAGAGDASVNAGGALNTTGLMPVILPPDTDTISAAELHHIPGAIPVNGASANVTADHHVGVANLDAGVSGHVDNHTIIIDDSGLVNALRQEQNANASLAANASAASSDVVVASSAPISTAVVVVPADAPVAVVTVQDTKHRSRRQATDSGNIAHVSAKVGNSEVNQTLAVGDQPVVAILPPGSNLTATWNAQAGGPAPAVLTSSDHSDKHAVVASQSSDLAVPVAVATVHSSDGLTASNSSNLAVVAPAHLATDVAVDNHPAVVVVATKGTSSSGSASSGDDAAAKADLAAAHSANSGSGGVPVILPVGMSSAGLTQESLANIPGALPIVVNGPETSNTRVNVPRPGKGDSLFVIQQNHRFELRVVSYEINQGSTAVHQKIQVLANLTAGALPPSVAQMAANVGHDITPIDASNPKLLAPESTTGYQEILNGDYAGGSQTIDHTLSLDLCGQIPDKALLRIVAKPSGTLTTGLTADAKYVCPLNLNFQTATRVTEANWSDTNFCESTAADGQFKQKLGYQIRNYNINWEQCQQSRPSIAVA